MRFAKESSLQANRLKQLNEVTKLFRQSQVLGTLVFHNFKNAIRFNDFANYTFAK